MVVLEEEEEQEKEKEEEEEEGREKEEELTYCCISICGVELRMRLSPLLYEPLQYRLLPLSTACRADTLQ